MGDNSSRKIDETARAIGDLEATVNFLADQIHQLRKEIKNSTQHTAIFRFIGVTISGLFLWLGVLTAFLIRG